MDKASKKKPKRLIKITVREADTKKIVIELLPTEKNRKKAINMAALAGLEVIRVYDE